MGSVNVLERLILLEKRDSIAETMIAGTVIIAEKIKAPVIPLVKASCTAIGILSPPTTNIFIICSREIVPIISGKDIPMRWYSEAGKDGQLMYI